MPHQPNAVTPRDTTRYAAVLEEIRAASRPEPGRLVSFFDRPGRSALDRAMVALLCTGKYRTFWRGAPLMKDALSWVILATMLQEIRPRTLFDLGTCGGGAALWLADLSRALDLDAQVVTVDVSDLRSEEVRLRMQEDPRIRFCLGDLTRPASCLPPDLLAALPHPWLVLEDAHVPTLPLLTHFHLHGVKDGDYILFEDTHEEGPNVSGMGAHDMERYETGFGAQKTRALTLAMTVYGLEYEVDTRYADMFGSDASFMSNAILRRVEPAETARILEIDGHGDVSPEEVTRCLAEDGHVLLRPRRGTDEIPHERIFRLLGVTRPNLYTEGTEKRSAREDARYLEVTRFPSDQPIPPHHELFYTPSPPARIAFVCLVPPPLGGETAIYDGKRAYGFLPDALRERIVSQRVLWRRNLGPPGEATALENTTWSRVLATDDFTAALEAARAQGYTVARVDHGAREMTLDCLVPMQHDGILATSVAGNHPWIYEVFYGGALTSHESIRWEDGTELSESEVLALLQAYARARVHVRWTRRGEVLILDNRRFAHGRQPWSGGPREIAVIMGT